MTITAKQLETRHQYVGASDVATIVGANPFRNITDLWYEKLGLLTPDQNVGIAAEIGNWCEAGLLDHLEHSVGKIRRGGARRWKACDCVLIHPDGVVVSTRAPAEAKTTGMLGPVYGDWGEDGTDEVPDYVTVQVQTQIAALEADNAHVIAMVGGRGLRQYELVRDDELIAELQYYVDLFWNHNVMGNVQPVEVPTMDTLKRVRRVPKSIAEMPAEAMETLDQWIQARKDATSASKLSEGLKEQLVALLGTAEGGQFEDGRAITYLEQTRAERLVAASTFRVARPTTMDKLEKKWS